MTSKEMILKRLYENRDEKYLDFNSKLIPNVDKSLFIGVRTPVLRAIAKEAEKREDIKDFLDSLPHKYFEENNVHGFIIENIKDYDECIKRLEEFLPYIDNWATCDLISPKVFRKNRMKLIEEIMKWIKSEKPFTCRFGIEMMMSHFLDEDFKEEYLHIIGNIKSEEYYVNMMIAWYFATALAKQYDKTIPVIENKILDKWVQNKAIQKSVESRRITDEQKKYLKTLKIS